MKKIICTKKAPQPVGPYSQAVLIDGFLYCSGQIAIDSASNTFINGTIEQQSTIVMENIKALLDEAGFCFDDVIKTTCFLDDMDNFCAFNEIYSKYFTSNPARSCVQAKLPKGAKVEVEIIAHK